MVWIHKMFKVGGWNAPKGRNEKWILCNVWQRVVRHNRDRHLCIILLHNRCCNHRRRHWTEDGKSLMHHPNAIWASSSMQQYLIMFVESGRESFILVSQTAECSIMTAIYILISFNFAGGRTERCNGHKFNGSQIGLAFTHQQHRGIYWGLCVTSFNFAQKFNESSLPCRVYTFGSVIWAAAHKSTT